mgnify:CR=1 FL=1
MGLERIGRVKEALRLSFSSVVFTVAGTNGKGSVSAMVEAILHAAGWRTGLYTSPHLVHLGERVQVDRVRLTEEEIVVYADELGAVADDICLIRSMHTGVNNHGQSINALNTGRALGGRPTLGSWLAYGLGAEARNLPAYVALTDPRGLPVLGVENWSNGWLRLKAFTTQSR